MQFQCVQGTRIGRNNALLASLQRKVLLRVVMAYRTVSTVAVPVLAATLPIHLLAEERSAMDEIALQDRCAVKLKQRSRSLQKWQVEWQAGGKGVWSRYIITELESWVK